MCDYCRCAPCSPVVHALCTLGGGYVEACSCCPIGHACASMVSCCAAAQAPNSVVTEGEGDDDGDAYYIVTGANRNVGFWAATTLAQVIFRVMPLPVKPFQHFKPLTDFCQRQRQLLRLHAPRTHCSRSISLSALADASLHC